MEALMVEDVVSAFIVAGEEFLKGSVKLGSGSMMLFLVVFADSFSGVSRGTSVCASVTSVNTRYFRLQATYKNIKLQI
jgi:hypothetical protein